MVIIFQFGGAAMEEKKKRVRKYDPEKYNPEVQRKATAKYDAKMTVYTGLKLNIKTDADLLNKLDTVKNKQGYIKELIRRDTDLYISGKI